MTNPPDTDKLDKTTSKQEDTPEGKTEVSQDEKAPKEYGGREGPDPVRYGDWENNGIASDF